MEITDEDILLHFMGRDPFAPTELRQLEPEDEEMLEHFSSPQPQTAEGEALPMPSRDRSPGLWGGFSLGLHQSLAGLPYRSLPGTPSGTAYEDLPPAAQRTFMVGRSIGDNVPMLASGAGLPAAARYAYTTASGAFRAMAPSLPAAGQTFARRAVDPIIRSYATSPATFGATEMAAIGGAAQGRWISEALFPGDEGMGALLEMTGAVLNPVGIALNASPSLNNVWRTVARQFKAGQRKEAAEILQHIASSLGEDPVQLARQIQQYSDLPALPGQQIHSRTLNSLFKHLASKDPDLHNLGHQRLLDSHNQINDTINSLFASGDPEAIRTAARMREGYFNTLNSSRLESAIADADAAVAALRIQDPQERAAAASDLIVRKMYDSIDWAKRVQDELYGPPLARLAKETVDDFGESYPEVMRLIQRVGGGNASFPNESVDRTFRRIYGTDVGDGLLGLLDVDPTSVKHIQMYNIAVEAGNQASIARKARNFKRAHMLEDLRHVILHRIDQIPDTGLDEARAFTRSYKDVFERSFASTVLPTSDAQHYIRTPERAMRTAIAGGGVQARDRLRALESAANFGQVDAGPITPEGWVVRNEQEMFLLSHANKFFKDGRVDPNALQRFADSNQALLSDFPEVQEIFSSAISTELMLTRMARSQDLINDQIVNRSLFRRLANSEDFPDVDAAINSIMSDDPVSGIRRIMSTLRASAKFAADDPDATQDVARLIERGKEGLVASIWDSAIARNTRSDGTVNWTQINNTLNTQVRRGQPSTVELLHRHGAITREQATTMSQMMRRGAEIDAARNDPTRLGQLIADSDMLSQVLMRASGSRVATKLFGGGTQAGPSLIIAHAGSKAFQKFMGTNPRGAVADILTRAMHDRDLLVELLTRDIGEVTSAQVLGRIHRINGALYGAGISAEITSDEIDYLKELLQGVTEFSGDSVTPRLHERRDMDRMTAPPGLQ